MTTNNAPDPAELIKRARELMTDSNHFTTSMSQLQIIYHFKQLVPQLAAALEVALSEVENLKKTVTALSAPNIVILPKDDSALKAAQANARREALLEVAKIMCPFCQSKGNPYNLEDNLYHVTKGNRVVMCKANEIHKLIADDQHPHQGDQGPGGWKG